MESYTAEKFPVRMHFAVRENIEAFRFQRTRRKIIFSFSSTGV
jgi:hypothetical protein